MHPAQCSFQTNRVTLQQMEKFKYLEATFSSDGKQSNEVDIRIGKASAIMRQLYQSVVMKRELCTKAKLFVFRSVFLPIFTYAHEYWVMTERVRSRVAYRRPKRFFCEKSRGSSLLDKVKSTEIRQYLKLEPLLLRIERSPLRWYGYVT